MAQKSFKNDLPTVNPALQFISQADPQPEPEATIARSTAPIGYKPNPEYIEKRTVRLQLVTAPSLRDKMTATAKRQGISTNELVNRAITAYIEGSDDND